MDHYQSIIWELNQRIRQLEFEMKVSLDKQQRKYEAELHRLEEKMRRKNEVERMKLEKEYKRKLQEYGQFMRGELTSLDKEMHEEIRQKNRQIASLKYQMKDIEKQLKEEVNNLKNNIKDDLKRKKEIAGEYIKEFNQVLKHFDHLPHLKFTPHKLETISDVKKEFKTLGDGEMYEAQAAVAISGTSSLHRLEIEVDEEATHWKREYAVYKQYTSHLFYTLWNQLSSWNPDWALKIEDIEQDLHFYKILFKDNEMNLMKEIDFWSFGQYYDIFERLEDEMSLILEIEEQGIDNYLLDVNSIAIGELSNKITEIHRVLENIYDIYLKAVDNQVKYNERKTMMDNLLRQFEIKRNVKRGKIAIEKPQDDSTRDYVNYKILAKNLKGDPRRSMHGVLLGDKDLSIHIYIRPEDLKVRYRNIIILCDDFGEHQGYLVSTEYDDYKMLLRILREEGLKIDDMGYEDNDLWYIPFLNLETISNLQLSTDENIKKFAGKLNKFIKSR